MAQYIDKAAVVAEIKVYIDGIEISQKAGLIKKRDADKKISILKGVLSLIESLEVKEIDEEPVCTILPRPAGCYSTCKECPYLATNNKIQKWEKV